MKAFVKVEDAWMRDKVAIHIAERGERHIHIVDFSQVVAHTEDLETSAATTSPTYDPLYLSHDMARALYEELGRHFGGAPETATLRKDYESERARVDLFIAKAVGA